MDEKADKKTLSWDGFDNFVRNFIAYCADCRGQNASLSSTSKKMVLLSFKTREWLRKMMVYGLHNQTYRQTSR